MGSAVCSQEEGGGVGSAVCLPEVGWEVLPRCSLKDRVRGGKCGLLTREGEYGLLARRREGRLVQSIHQRREGQGCVVHSPEEGGEG